MTRTMARTFDPVTLRLFVAVCEERNIAELVDRYFFGNCDDVRATRSDYTEAVFGLKRIWRS